MRYVTHFLFIVSLATAQYDQLFIGTRPLSMGGAFIAVADEMAKAAENLVRIAEAGELREFSQALRPLGKSCKDCHDQFRKRR